MCADHRGGNVSSRIVTRANVNLAVAVGALVIALLAYYSSIGSKRPVNTLSVGD